MKTYRLFYLIAFILALSFSAKAQNVGVGAEGIYNFQTESIGFGARVNIFPNNKLSFVPQFAYYPAFNKIHEYNLGLGLEYKIIRQRKFNVYAILAGAYNSWLNYSVSPLKDAKKNNWNLEGGVGISGKRCLRPFIEYRYNIKFQETNLHLGLLYIIGCGGRGNRRCDAYSSL